MKDYEFYKEELRGMLSEKRFIHSVNVGNMAERLAKQYGVDTNKAKIAGLLHDICKEMNESELVELLNQAKPEIFDVFKDFAPKLYHGPAASVYLKKELGIEDEEMLRAVCFHTTGCPNMTTMEKIVSVADHVSDERPFDDVKDMQEIAMKNLDEAILRKCRIEIPKCIKKGLLIHPYTVSSYNDALIKGRKTGE